MQYRPWTVAAPVASRPPAWALVYATIDAPLDKALASITAGARDARVFGCTSFQGVFSPVGFTRGVHVLAGDPGDGVTAVPAIRASSSARARNDSRVATLDMAAKLGARPDAILLHATPGYEERVLDGIEEAFEGNPPPVYGGSAADDTIHGDWRVFAGTEVVADGFVVAGFKSKHETYGSFVAGYTPTATRGKVTAARGRIVDTIDGEPAAKVYNDWTHGSIAASLKGGVVLAETTLRPLGRLIDRVGAVPRYLLSHPHEVLPNGSLALFTEVRVGDELVLMVGSEGALLDRTTQVAARARGGGGTSALSGAILVYCGGCVGALGDKTAEVSKMFSREIRSAPFVGAATFGVQGCFSGVQSVNRHGNLMCDAILFGA